MIINTRNLLGHTTGVQRYTQSIIEEFNDNNFSYTTIQPKTNTISGVKGHLWEQVILPFNMMKTSKKGVLWSPSNVGPISISNQIVTIHDTVPFDHPEWLNKSFVSCYKYLQPLLAKKVRHIITISEFSKQRIIEHLKVPESKISVIYNGVNIKKESKQSLFENKFLSLGNYILSVGSLEPRKNISRLLEAFELYQKETNSDIKLVIVGHEGVTRVFKSSYSNVSRNNKNIIYTGHVSDAELSYLYENAKGFCYPSMYEGFGLPPLEAMSYGIPVLTSNTTALKELCENRAILVDPHSVSSIAEGIYSLIHNNPSFININNNKSYADSLSWSRCALRTHEVLSSF